MENYLQERYLVIYPNSYLVAHATLSSFAFIILLPIGVLIGRYRLVGPGWFYAHVAVQAFAAFLIIPGFALGVVFKNRLHALGAVTSARHNSTGIALFVMYWVQVILGVVIHLFKMPRFVHRPPQNYFHAILGLAIIGLAMAQVHDGYYREYPLWGIRRVPFGVHGGYIAMVVIFATFYVAGLALLPEQYKRESEDFKNRRGDGSQQPPMSSVGPPATNAEPPATDATSAA